MLLWQAIHRNTIVTLSAFVASDSKEKGFALSAVFVSPNEDISLVRDALPLESNVGASKGWYEREPQARAGTMKYLSDNETVKTALREAISARQRDVQRFVDQLSRIEEEESEREKNFLLHMDQVSERYPHS
jgi:hypothetical protein